MDIAEQHYHIYNRGVEKRVIFIDDIDYRVFLNLIKRYIDEKPHVNAHKVPYSWLGDEIELLAFCLMPNHFHLLLYQIKEGAMKKLMQNVCASYTSYFNKKYKRVGHLFQGVYKASTVMSDSYAQHISRYIHLNPDNYRDWEYSSLPYFLDQKKSGWVKPKRILKMFDNIHDYDDFLKDYEGQKEIMDELKLEMADV